MNKPKKELSRRDFLRGTTLGGVGFVAFNELMDPWLLGSNGQPLRVNDEPAISQLEASIDDLYQGFENPPKEYDLIPLWTWNGRIEINEAKRQIDEMLGQGLRRAIVYPFPNLRIRFLSDAWWTIWEEVLAYSRTKNFQLGVNAENQWPDGDAFDQWLDPPDQSHVLLGHPEYHMKRLAYVERDFVGPGTVRFHNLPDPVIAVAARLKGESQIDGDSLVDLSHGISAASFSAELSDGDWRLIFFHLVNTVGSNQQLRIDPLNRAAVARFIDVTLGEYYRRFKEYFGNTFTFVLVDNEGDYGNPIAWTPSLFETFQSEKGYDLRKYLPLLMYDGGPKTPKVRIDYLRVISNLYRTNYWGQMAEWCKGHGLQMTAQGLSESLEYDAACGGDYMEMMRSLGMPGVESLGNRGRSPREFVENQSIADFDGKRYWCEGPLVLGTDTYISPQKERYATNMLGLWGIDLWSPQFYYDVPAMSYPPDDFVSQPWWKYFHHYTDYVRRIGYMNGEGKHVADLLLFRPVDTTFAYSKPLFQFNESGAWTKSGLTVDSTATPPSSTSMIRDSGYEPGSMRNDYYPCLVWKGNFAATVETAYFDLMELLVGFQRSFNVADDYYMNMMALDGGALQISDMRFRGIILPPMKVITRVSLAKIRKFYEAGGLVIAYGDLPVGSSEEGWGDPAVTADIRAIFGVPPGWKKYSENQNSQGGKAYFVLGNVERVLEPIDQNLAPDLKVVQGSRERLLYLHKVKGGRDLYWIVNDTERPRQVVVSLATKGKPQLWDPATGARRDTPYWVEEGRTVLRLNFHIWDATYVVFDKTEVPAPEIGVTRTNLEDYTLQQTPGGEIRIEGRVPANVQQVFAEGRKAGKEFRVNEINPRPIEPQVLSPQGWKFNLQAKNVEVKYAREKLIGKGRGFAAGFAQPEYSDDTWPVAHLSPERVTFRDWWVLGPFPNPEHGEGYNTAYPPEQRVDLDATYTDMNEAEIGWRRYHSSESVVNLSKALGSDPKAETVAYAMTWVYASHEEQVESLLVAPNAKFWINGDLVFARHRRPNYYEMRDPFGAKRSVLLKKGWNQVLVKMVGDRRNTDLLFYLHFLDKEGVPVDGLETCWQPNESEALKKIAERSLRDENAEQWYRLQVPPGTRAFLLPQRDLIGAVYLNGREVKPRDGRIEYPDLDLRQPAILAFKVPGGKELTSPLSFESGETVYHLGCWTGTGLTYYAGSAAYEKSFVLAPEMSDHEIELDCGSVGVVAEVWLNGQKAGERIWEPFSINVTRFLKPGENWVKVIVTNTYAAMRTDPARMDVIDMNGLVGPVRLVPYRNVQLTVHR